MGLSCKKFNIKDKVETDDQCDMEDQPTAENQPAVEDQAKAVSENTNEQAAVPLESDSGDSALEPEPEPKVEGQPTEQPNGQSLDLGTNDQPKVDDQVVTKYKAEIDGLINDLQRTRADFENYRKHTEQDVAVAQLRAVEHILSKLLPTIDIIDNATAQVPTDLVENEWVKGIVAMRAKLLKSLGELGVEPMIVKPGDPFDHNQHNAIQFDESEGDIEVVAAVLRMGYFYRGQVLRPAMVSVTRK